ncbi:hypothetical protein N658DRAFT_488840 [Parathielavia hyrcaniae]|uniref:Clr5 domain-containing protein n=1 Tax=Parathielavia hyrcaniae TaxID=113614 RepID=A0AAN6PYT9_9PEZI|nr:hypothetical protein N658DRAFT_488840 [Parathielavia hyrcaniae]
MDDTAASQRRTYKRYPGETWNAHMPTIRKLYLEDDMTYKEVALALKTDHDFDVGERQLKRWTDKWGFYKHIPDKEMRKMAKRRQQRQQQHRLPTKCLRRLGNGEFQEVPITKLDAFVKRSGPRRASAAAISPSSVPQEIGDPAASTPRTAGQLTIEFNQTTERVFDETNSVCSGSLSTSALCVPEDHDGWEPGAILASTISRFQRGLDEAIRENHQVASAEFKTLLRIGRLNHWARVIVQFYSDVMDVACYPGGPQSLAARVVDVLSRTLIRVREEYSRGNPGVQDTSCLQRLLMCLKEAASGWVPLLMEQRALRIWEPILGAKHPHILLLQSSLAGWQAAKGDCHDSDSDEDELSIWVSWLSSEDAFDHLRAIDMSHLGPAANLFHLGDAPPTRLLEDLWAVEGSSISGAQPRHNATLLRLGRSRAKLGVYYSFLRRFDEAEKALQVSELHMGHETCVELRLFRTLWYAEHKTRVGGWSEVEKLMSRAHHIFMTDDDLSEFVIRHFPERFERLYVAVKEQLPLDAIISEVANPEGHETVNLGPSSPYLPGNPVSASPASPAAAAEATLSHSQLFPCTPEGINAEIDINAWREFVRFSPARIELSATLAPVE